MPNLTSVGVTAGIPTSGTGTVSTIDNIPALWDKGTGTGGSLTQRVIVDSSQLTTVGQAVMASSTPVVIASNQSAVPIKSNASATGTQTSVASSATDVTILASNANRLGAMVYNDSTQILYLLQGSGTSSNTNYSVQLVAGAYYEVPFGYTGVLKGLWASANGNARVTENT